MSDVYKFALEANEGSHYIVSYQFGSVQFGSVRFGLYVLQPSPVVLLHMHKLSAEKEVRNDFIAVRIPKWESARTCLYLN